MNYVLSSEKCYADIIANAKKVEDKHFIGFLVIPKMLWYPVVAEKVQL